MSKVNSCGPQHGCHTDHHDRGGPDHLDSVRLGDETYNLNNPKERKKFDDAIDDLKKKGVDIEYNRKNNKVYVDGEEAYDLDKARDLKDFNKDRNDGELDGRITGKHLQNVEINGQKFNLGTAEGREAFEKDLADGKIDGKNGTPTGDVWFDAETNEVYVGQGKDTHVFDLDNKGDFFDFRRDALDDGNVNGSNVFPAETPAAAPVPTPQTPTTQPPPNKPPGGLPLVSDFPTVIVPGGPLQPIPGVGVGVGPIESGGARRVRPLAVDPASQPTPAQAPPAEPPAPSPTKPTHVQKPEETTAERNKRLWAEQHRKG